MPGERRRAKDANAEILTEIVLLVFRVNGRLLSAGDRLVADLGLTSARWQMLGAVAMADRPRTSPQLAAGMGMTRQAAQKQLDLLMEDGLVAAQANPGHARSPLYVLTRQGNSVWAATERVQTAWASRLADRFSLASLETTKQLLDNLNDRLSLS